MEDEQCWNEWLECYEDPLCWSAMEADMEAELDCEDGDCEEDVMTTYEFL